jgi:poly(3-hydroxybutyrate) depolymerase
LAWGGAASAGQEPAASQTTTATGEVRLSLSPDGHFGAWLVAGPFDRSHVPDGEKVTPSLGAPAGESQWRLAASDSALDLTAVLDARWGERFALAGGTLHIEHGGRHYLLLGVDDGVSVFVDGKRTFGRDEGRPQRDDDDLLSLDLSEGDHTLVLGLHQHIGAWSFRARLLDADLQPPRGATWTLPGTTPESAQEVATKMSTVTLDRGPKADGYHPTLAVRFPQGAPRGVRLDVHARLSRGAGAEPVFDVDAGEVPVGERGVRELSVALPRVGGDEIEDSDCTMHVEVAGRSYDLPFHARRETRAAIVHADRALTVGHDESVEYLRNRLASYVAKGDPDLEAQLADARELDDLARALEDKRDPWAGRTGAMRRAYVSPADGKLTEFAVYVPPSFDPQRRYPLIVALHGMNGKPMEMIMWLFGHDDPARDGYWEDRHPRHDLDKLDAIVVAPDGSFNAMYRDMGEDDVMHVTDWAMAHYPIDPSRVTITGPSMGGIGTAACALRYPARFAAAEPLCGYHSYLIRAELKWLRPWERILAEERSNVSWAENGQYLPMYVVHGTRDLPEENSGVLIDRYNELHYSMKDEHPDLGHNVWQTTYEDLKGAQWLLGNHRPMHPRALRFKTPRTRWGDDAWLHVRELTASDTWGEIQARGDRNTFVVVTHGVDALGLDRDPEIVDDAEPVTVFIDQSKLVFQAGEELELHRDGSWKAGPAAYPTPHKHGHVTGPLRDVLHDPILVVWGASDPSQARANEEVGHAWAHVRPSVRVDYPVMSDAEFLARGEAIDNDRALVLVGNAKSNRLVRELEGSFPIRIEGDEIVLGEKHIAAKDGLPADRSQLGVAFIRPNPRRTDRYVVVVEGVGPLGTWRSLSLPDMLPDYCVFDEDITPSRGGLVLGAGSMRAAGNFANDWSLPQMR